MTIQAVLFDKDGTLIDFNATYAPAFAAIVRELAGAEAADTLASAVGFDLQTNAFAPGSVAIAGSSLDIAQALAPVLGRASPGELAVELDARFDVHVLASIAPFAQAGPALAQLRASGLRLGVATNDAEAAARSHVAAIGLAQYFDFYAGYDSGHGAKPQPGMVAAFARHCSLPPAAVAMVGDSTHDMAAGRTAGALTIAVTTGPAGTAELAPLADHVIADLGELPGLIAGLG